MAHTLGLKIQKQSSIFKYDCRFSLFEIIIMSTHDHTHTYIHAHVHVRMRARTHKKLACMFIYAHTNTQTCQDQDLQIFSQDKETTPKSAEDFKNCFSSVSVLLSTLVVVL